MNNIDVRNAIAKARLKHWEVAEKMGIGETAFSKMLRKELTTEKKELIFNAIAELTICG